MGSGYSVNLDYLKDLDKIPGFKDRVNELKKLQKKSIKYHIEDYRIIPDITDDFADKYYKLIADIINYLKEEFPDQTKHTGPSKYNSKTQKYMTDFEEKYDINNFEHTDYNIVVDELYSYIFCCCSIYYNCKSTKNISMKYTQHIYDTYADYKSEWQTTQTRKEKIEKEREIRELEIIGCRDKLIETMTMHYFPDRVENGIRKPAEWIPDFNLILVEQVKKQIPNFNIVEWATKQPAYEKKREELINAHKEKNIREQIKNEELKALLTSKIAKN